jgi:hypothetical protein
VAWGLRRATVRNTALSADNCNVRRNRNRFVVSMILRHYAVPQYSLKGWLLLSGILSL